MSRGVPVTIYTNPGGMYGVETFIVTTLCGQSNMGMTQTPDLEISTRRALAHADQCERCRARWDVLCQRGTLVSTGEDAPEKFKG